MQSAVSKFLKRRNLVLAVFLAAGLFLRLFFLAKNNLWFDEAFTLFSPLSHFSPALSSYFKTLANYPELPFYPLFINIWIKLFGASEFTLRLPSALFSFFSIPVVYLLTKKIFNEETALVASAIMVFSPFHLWYAQEARSYSLALFLGLLSIYYFYILLKENNTKNVSAYILFSALALYTNYFAIFLLASQFSYVLFFARDKIKKGIFFVPLLPFLLFLPWFTSFIKAFSMVKGGFWIPRPHAASLLITLENFILGYNGTTIFYLCCDFFIALALIVSLLKLTSTLKVRQELIFCIWFAFFPVLFAYAASKYTSQGSIYLDRGFILFSPFFYILLAFAIVAFSLKAAKLLLIAGLFFLLGTGDGRYFLNQMYMPDNPTHHMGVPLKKSYKPLMKFLGQELDKNSCIIVTNIHLLPVAYYLKTYIGLPEEKLLSFCFFACDPDLTDGSVLRTYKYLCENHPGIVFIQDLPSIIYPVRNPAARGAFSNGVNKKIFLLGCDWTRSGALDQNSRKIKESLDKILKLEKDLNFDGIRLFIYKN